MKRILLLLAICVLAACSDKPGKITVERAFYYWKSNESGFNAAEDSTLTKTGASTVYLKFFEVERHPMMGNIPVSKNRFYNYGADRQKIIPTVYLRNEVFLDCTKGSLDTLATNVTFLINKFLDQDSIHVKEFQMDCDWTAKTKDHYFYYLRQLKKISGKTISCTLRLYPYKYPEKMGVPPVDKATLMCYNLLSPTETPKKNSILDTDELAAYLKTEKKYPLHLDVALPLYSWMQVYANDRFSEVIYSNTEDIMPALRNIKPLWYVVVKDTTVNYSHYLRIGDNIKYEKITAEKIRKAIDLLKNNVDFDENITVTFFHLDDNQLKNFSNETLSGFYADFSR